MTLPKRSYTVISSSPLRFLINIFSEDGLGNRVIFSMLLSETERGSITINETELLAVFQDESVAVNVIV